MKLGTLRVSTAGGLNNQPHSGHCLVVAKLIKGSQSSAGALRDWMTMMTMMEDGGGGGTDIGLLYWVTVTHFIPAAFFMLLAIWSVSFCIILVTTMYIYNVYTGCPTIEFSLCFG